MDKIDFSHEFDIKDSGTRTEFEGGMVRDADAGNKTDYTSVMFGPMLERWAVHCTKGRVKYPDHAPGIPNWTLASSIAEWLHARGSLLRHTMAFLRGETDEDHAAAIMFNVNVMEYVRERIGWTPDVFIAAPVSEDNAGPSPAVGVNEVPYDFPLDLTGLSDMFGPGGEYAGPKPPGYDSSLVPSGVVVQGRLVRRGLDAIKMISDIQPDGPWCDSESPLDDEIGGVWHCERPPGHLGDHAWNPLECGWNEDAGATYITRWGANPLYRIDTREEEELPDE